MLEIRQPNNGDSPGLFRDFIVSMINEDTFLIVNKKPTLKEEKKWVKERLAGIRRGNELLTCAFDGKKLVGNCDARRGYGKESGNVEIGLAISKDYRGRGLGEKLLRKTIALVKKRFRAKNIHLRYIDGNKPAMSLYKKVGFRELTRMPKWVLYRGKYRDEHVMLLKK